MRSSSLARVAIAGLGVSVVLTLGCGKPKPPTEPSPLPTVTVEFGGRVVNADAGGPVANVRVAVSSWRARENNSGLNYAKETAMSGGDGTFTIQLTLPPDWTGVSLELTSPAGYDNTRVRFVAPAAQCWFSPCWAAADRPTIRMYPALVIRPGESIEVRVEGDIVWCGSVLVDLAACRRVVVESGGDPVELEIVPHDISKPMTLALISDEIEFPDVSVRRLILTVPPGRVPYVISDFSTGTATLTARR